MSNLIQHSPDIARRLNARVRQVEHAEIAGDRIKDMGYAKHRYSSSSQPFSRNVLWFDAVLGLCQELSAVRSGDVPAKASQHFMHEIDEEIYHQPGMMSDSFDECLGLTRYLVVINSNLF